MMTKLFLSFALVLGVSACVTDDNDDDLMDEDDDDDLDDLPVFDPENFGQGQNQVFVLGTEDISTGVNVLPPGANNTCGGLPRRKADGACIP